MLTKTNSIPVILAQTFGVAILLSAMANLIPRGARHGIGDYEEWTANDGLGIIFSFTKPLHYFETQLRG
jgi:hypothetical protein